MSDSDAKKPPKTVRAGDTVTTKVTLVPGHAVPQTVSSNFNLTPPPQTYDQNRPTSFVLASWLTPAPPVPTPNVVTLTGAIPHHIVGGTYKPVNVSFGFGNDPPQYENNPDPDGDLVLQVVDDPPTAADKPIIKDFDLV